MGRYWQRHPKTGGEDALKEFDQLGWKIEDPPTYYTVKCPCGDHMTQVHISPSNPRHYEERLRWAKRQPCMKDRKGK